jgi:hypothetical protein
MDDPNNNLETVPQQGRGRPTKMSAEIIGKITTAYGRGLSFEESCRVAGIAPSTGFLWKEDPDFSEALKNARAQRKLTLLDRLEAADAKVDPWPRWAWLLERTDPASFARPELQLSQQLNIYQANQVDIVQLLRDNAAPLQALLHGKALPVPDSEG